MFRTISLQYFKVCEREKEIMKARERQRNRRERNRLRQTSLYCLIVEAEIPKDRYYLWKYRSTHGQTNIKTKRIIETG